MLIIDSHVHYMKVEGFKRSVEEELLAIMDRLKINKAVLMPLEALFPFRGVQENERIISVSRKFHGRFIPVVTVNPWKNDAVDELRGLLSKGAKALKLHPLVQGFTPINEIVYPILDLAEKSSIPVIFHTGTPIYSMPLQVLEVALTYPELNIVMGHMGLGEYWWDAIRAAKRADNVYLDTAGVRYLPVLEKAVKVIGAERILYGSDMPFLSPELELEKIRLLRISEHEKESILGLNAQKLFNLS